MITVQIIKASDPYLWYAREIGTIFTVEILNADRYSIIGRAYMSYDSNLLIQDCRVMYSEEPIDTLQGVINQIRKEIK